jgi:hypothetical protein
LFAPFNAVEDKPTLNNYEAAAGVKDDRDENEGINEDDNVGVNKDVVEAACGIKVAADFVRLRLFINELTFDCIPFDNYIDVCLLTSSA